ncbi:MAG TPA: hypothetical protein VH951_07670 [Dehalococcoidia bacterium]|jgi:hypothetical protein
MTDGEQLLLRRLTSSEAAAGGLLGIANAAAFAGVAVDGESRGRRAAASAVVVVNAALALESALYVAFIPGTASDTQAIAAVVARTALLVAVATMSVLVLRRRLGSRRRQ